jgi:hypothetical protein
VLSVLLLIPDAVVTVADHKGASRPQMRALLATAASLHARFWRTHTRGREYTLPALALASPAAATSSSSSSSSVVHGLFGVRPPSPTSAESSRHWFARATDHLVARHGVQWIGSIELFAPHHPRGKQWFAPIWTAITEFYRQYPNMTVSHGDCRPGLLRYLETISHQRVFLFLLATSGLRSRLLIPYSLIFDGICNQSHLSQATCCSTRAPTRSKGCPSCSPTGRPSRTRLTSGACASLSIPIQSNVHSVINCICFLVDSF